MIKGSKRKSLFFFMFFILSGMLFSQGVNKDKRGTIKVRKTGKIVRVEYDNVNYRLVGVDRFGNPLDTAVISFQMSVTINGVFYSETAQGNTLTYQMQQLLGRCDSRTPLFFNKIKVKDSYGTLIDVPQFKYLLGNSNDF